MLRRVQRTLRDHFTDARRGAADLDRRRGAGRRRRRSRRRRPSARQSHRDLRAELERVAGLATKAQALAEAQPAGPRRDRSASLGVEVRGVLRRAIEVYRDSPQAVALAAAPPRPASTSRCGSPSPARSRRASRRCSTRWSARRSRRPTPASAPGVVTWYQRRAPPRRDAVPHGRASRASCAIDATGTARCTIDLEGTPADDVDRLVVDWPSRQPAHHHADRHAGHRVAVDRRPRSAPARSSPRDERPTAADAVLYLMRHLHATDVRFLESFHDQGVAQGDPGQHDRRAVPRRRDRGRAGWTRMASARRIAARYRQDETLRGAVPDRRRRWPGCSRRPGGPCGRTSSLALQRARRAAGRGARRAAADRRPVRARRRPRAGPVRRGPGAGCSTGSGCSASGCRSQLIATAASTTRPSWPTELVEPQRARRAARGCSPPSSPSGATCSRPARRCSRSTRAAPRAAAGRGAARRGGRADAGRRTRVRRAAAARRPAHQDRHAAGGRRGRRPSACSAATAAPRRPGWACPGTPTPTQLRGRGARGARSLAAPGGEPALGAQRRRRRTDHRAQLRGRARQPAPLMSREVPCPDSAIQLDAPQGCSGAGVPQGCSAARVPQGLAPGR